MSKLSRCRQYYKGYDSNSFISLSDNKVMESNCPNYWRQLIAENAFHSYILSVTYSRVDYSVGYSNAYTALKTL